MAACISPNEDPLHESRMYAMAQIAIHDALNAIDRRSRPYAWSGRAKRRTSPDAAIAAAARGVLVPLLNEITDPFPPACAIAGVASVEADYAAALGAVPDARAKARGIAVGQAAAAAILELRAADGADTPLIVTDYEQGTAPGEWRFTPGFDFALSPGWGDVTPFVLADGSQFRPDPPYALTAKGYTADFNEIKRIGGDGITTPSTRNADQTEIARFWIESSPLQWNRIARSVAARADLDVWESARLFGLLNLALADGYIATFDTKFGAYDFWRPVTAIRLAGTDGNPDTDADPTWTPLDPTPPVPDHDSGHSVQGGAATQVLQRFFGTDRMRFDVCSYTLPAGSRCDDAAAVVRSYSRFSQAREENGRSRILVGYHFRKAVKDGILHGRQIGNEAVDREMRPVRHGHGDHKGGGH